jgi:DNA-binding LytR/AlgR family response regulator
VSAQEPTALIADDEPLLREALEVLLAREWPALRIVARARNGREAIELFETHRPHVCFLDVRMPGTSGVEAAQHIGRRAHLVFVTAYDQYAVQAFSHGVLDYLVKPVEPARLAETVARLRERLASDRPALATDAVLRELAANLTRHLPTSTLRWVHASVGSTVRLIAVDDIDYLRSEAKYTQVAWRDEARLPREAIIRVPLKQLLAQLDPSQFAQVHRSVVVNLGAVSHLTRDSGETAEIHLKGRAERLPVSRSFIHRFRQM